MITADEQWSANQVISGNSARPAAGLSETQQVTRDTGTLLSKKIWIPKELYAVLPYFYIASGVVALLATVYMGRWFWSLPHYLFFAAACLHMGIMVYRRRATSRKSLDAGNP